MISAIYFDMNLNSIIFWLLSLLILVLGSSQAHSMLITYEVKLRVDEIGCGFPCDGIDLAERIILTLGDNRVFRFSVDSSLLKEDGTNVPGRPQNFYASFGDTIWEQGQLFPESDLSGFRGPCYMPGSNCTDEEWASYGLGSDYWGFNIHNNRITGLWGGVFGNGDFPFIDFFGDRYSSLYFFEHPFNRPDLEYMARVGGKWSFHRVSEPSTFSIFLLSLIALIFFIRSRKSRNPFIS